MVRVHHPQKLAAERRFPHRVDIPVPPGGLGNRLNEMLDWCRANIRAGEWDQHGASVKEPGQIAVGYARFYFLTAEDADLFRWRWLSLGEAMSELSDKIHACLNYDLADTDKRLPAEYLAACRLWFDALSDTDQELAERARDEFEKGNGAEAEKAAADLPPAPKFPLS